jgi:hypothetical protein
MVRGGRGERNAKAKAARAIRKRPARLRLSTRFIALGSCVLTDKII